MKLIEKAFIGVVGAVITAAGINRAADALKDGESEFLTKASKTVTAGAAIVVGFLVMEKVMKPQETSEV